MHLRAIAIVGVVIAASIATAAGDPSAPEPPAPPAAAASDSVDAGVPAPDAPAPIDWLAIDPVMGHAQRIDGDETTGVVAFTFDDGPDPRTTPEVIAALEKYDVPASFFVVARRIVGKLGEKSLALAQREDREGFTVGCHSWSHKNLKHSTKADAALEVDQAQKTIAKALGHPIGMFRPPYGSLGGAAAADVFKRGLTDVIWSIDTLDWQAHNADKLRKKVLRMILAQNGGVVLMHDTKPITAKIIPLVLDDLEAENCARLARGDKPIVPVSLHYFLTDGPHQHGKGTPRPVPPEIAARTAAYEAALPSRCAARAQPASQPTSQPSK